MAMILIIGCKPMYGKSLSDSLYIGQIRKSLKHCDRYYMIIGETGQVFGKHRLMIVYCNWHGGQSFENSTYLLRWTVPVDEEKESNCN